MNAPITQQESTALTVAPRQQFDLSPQSFEQALTFSEYLAASEMVPKAYRGKPGDCLIAMQWGYELGLKPLQALQSIATINGKPGIYGDAGKAILLSKGCTIEEDDIAVVEKNCRARCKITRPGRPPVERTFSIDNAKTANLWGKEGPWRNYPWRQMAWRAFWFAARDAAADLLRGVAGFEELLDMADRPVAEAPTIKHMGAAEVVPPAQPACWPDDVFKERLPEWRKAIAAKKATADAIVAKARTKHPLTPEQEEAIREPIQAPAADVVDAGPVVTYAQVAALIVKAADTDKLAEAEDLIGSVADPEQREELVAMAATRRAELS